MYSTGVCGLRGLRVEPGSRPEFGVALMCRQRAGGQGEAIVFVNLLDLAFPPFGVKTWINKMVQGMGCRGLQVFKRAVSVAGERPQDPPLWEACGAKSPVGSNRTDHLALPDFHSGSSLK